MILRKNGEVYTEPIPEYVGMHIIIAIDSSKSNTAIVVGNTTGKVIDYYEVQGAGKEVNVYDLCADTRRVLKVIFKDAKILYVGIEDIITKKDHGKGNKALEIHQSRYKITAVFDNIIFTFQEFFNIMPNLIDNWSWKSDVLPAGYRTRDHKKGSKDYFRDIGSPFGSCKDDVTDAICIYIYVIHNTEFKIVNELRETIPSEVEYEYCFVPVDDEVNCVEFKILNNDSFEHNLGTIAERIKDGEIGSADIPIEMVSLKDIYSERLQKKYPKNTKVLKVLVRRT